MSREKTFICCHVNMELIFSDIEIINIEGVFESNMISTVPKIVKIPT